MLLGMKCVTRIVGRDAQPLVVVAFNLTISLKQKTVGLDGPLSWNQLLSILAANLCPFFHNNL